MGLLDKVFGRHKDANYEDVERGGPAPADPDTLTQPEAPAAVAGIASDPEPMPLEPVETPTATLEPQAMSHLEPQAVPSSGPPSGPPTDGIRAFDQNGREVIVPRDQWRTEVLPAMVKESWGNPDQLYLLILNSLNQGFLPEVTGAAEHLYHTDPVPVRGTCIWAIVLLHAKRTAEAEAVLNRYVAEHGDDAAVLTNLAKVYEDSGDTDRRDATLWRALELDPNLENALGWYAALAGERGGDAAAEEALERVRLQAGAWRPQLWLARGAMGANNGLSRATELYREAIARAPKPVPGELLMHLSGDLGGRGHVRELLELTAPEFVAEVHGLPVGNNLIKAYVDTGDLEAARAIHTALSGTESGAVRPDWQQALAYWDSEIRRRSGEAPAAEQEIQVGMLRVDGPIWLPGDSPARAEFAVRQEAGPVVVFLGGTAESPADPSQYAPGFADALARLTRSLPLFLSEQVSMRTTAQGRTMLPWAVGNGSTQPSGFVVSGQMWPEDMARQTVLDPAHRPDYVCIVHVDAEVEPWSAELMFLRASDGARIGELHQRFTPVDPEAGLLRLADELVDLLGAAAAPVSEPRYLVPSGENFPDYLRRLEQLLAVRCASMDGVPPSFLFGENEILEGDLALAQRAPESLPARLVARETLAAMGKVRPEIAAPYTERVEALTPVSA